MQVKWNKYIWMSFLLVVMVLPISLSAISQGAPLFLLIEQGSRPGGMGQAYVAQCDDAFAGYWNPGALAFNRKTQIAGMHVNWFGDVDGINDIYIEYLGWNQFFEDLGTIGANITYITYGEQDLLDFQGDSHGTFSSYEIAVGMSYGYQASRNLGLGLTFKWIYSDLAPDLHDINNTDGKGRGMSFAFDFGLKRKNLDPAQIALAPYNGLLALYNGIAYLAGMDYVDYAGSNFSIEKLDFGMNLQNLGPDIDYANNSQKDPLPLNLRMGLSYRLLDSDLNKMTINADINKDLANEDAAIESIITGWTDDDLKEEFRSMIYNFGGEYIYMNLIALRGGYILDKAGSFEGPSFGAGLTYTFSNSYKLSLDFAYQQAGELTDYNKTFSLGLEF